jgi:peptidyl-prolyl cis-trans isomerase D
MSVIQKIRDKYAAVVIAVIALSLVGFILMDAFVGRGRGAGSSSTTIGKVNGEKIDRNDFEKRLTMQQTMYASQGAQREQLISSVWEQSVDEIVMKQEYEKLGLQFTDKELNDLLFGPNAPQWLKNEFTDQATGQFKVAEAKQYFAQMKKQKNNPNLEMFNEGYIYPTISQALREKYMALLTQTVYVPKWMAEKTIADQNAIASFSYVMVPFTSISDSTIKVTDDDIKSYVDKHKEEFKQEDEVRSVSYVSFSAFPNAQDSANVFNSVNNLKAEFAAAPDPAAYLARVSSETPYLNSYIIGSKIMVPNADTIKALADGQVFGPYLDAKNYTLAKMIGRRTIPDSVKIRHILVKTAEAGQPTLPDSIAKARIDSIENAIKGGADFNAMVIQYSDDQGSKTTKGEYDFASTQFADISKEFAETAFYGSVGDKKVVKVDNPKYAGYHYIEVLQQKNPGVGFKIAYLSKPIDASQETINTANSAAAQFSANSRNQKQFEENAAKQSLSILPAADIKPNDFALPGLGESRQFIRWIYENKVGDVSEPYEIGDNYVVALITGTQQKGVMGVAKARQVAEPFIRNEKKAQQIINTKFKGGATIEAIAQTAGEQVLRADSVSFAQPQIPNVGNEPKVTGAAFNKSIQGKVTEPIAGNTGVFVVKGEKISAVAGAISNPEDLRKQMEMQQKQMGGFRSMEALKKAATITDKRSDFY